MGMTIEAACYEAVMEKHFRVLKGLGLTKIETKEEFYGFKAEDVVCVYSHKHGSTDGRGAGVYFRLNDCRVIDTGGREHDPNPIWYDQTTH